MSDAALNMVSLSPQRFPLVIVMHVQIVTPIVVLGRFIRPSLAVLSVFGVENKIYLSRMI